MEKIVCKSCGGSLTRVGNFYICDFCNSKWPVETDKDLNAVEITNAWLALRNNDFEKAQELFEDIILKDGKNYELYWGRALAYNSIVYVTDYNENKKVPTCNNITEESFLENKDVKKAIALAPVDIKESYQKQAELIEKIRIEWLEKASKEPAYDVFISFKDSDRERGIERTQDSIDVQDLYTALVQKGYNVFFSRVTLRDKVSEHYEPYIYNAIKTAKVMIVFGEKLEYFNATWIKNEWSRYKTRLEKGKKHKNSLITVYKNLNPNDIPKALTGNRQALDYSIPSNFEILMNHVKKIVDESKQTVKLEKIEIKGGQLAKKSSEIKTETIVTREIGNGSKAETDIDSIQKLNLVYIYMKSGMWADAKTYLEEVIFESPTNAKALLLSLFVKYKIYTTASLDLASLFKEISNFTDEDINKINYIISIADKNLAEEILNAFYNAKEIFSEENYSKLLKLIIPYNFDNRVECIKNLLTLSIVKENYGIFSLLLSTLDNTAVDEYISINLIFLKHAKLRHNQKLCIQNVLSVQEGNVTALKYKLGLEIENKENTAISTLETLLKYSSDINEEVKNTLSVIINKKEFTEYDVNLANNVLKYYPGELSEIEDHLCNLAEIMVNNHFFEDAERICLLIINFNKKSALVYWLLCLCKVRVANEEEILDSDVPIKSIPEFTKYLSLATENESLKALDISKQQGDEIRKRQAEIEEVNKAKRKYEAIRRKYDKRAGNRAIIITALALVAMGLLTLLSSACAEWVKLNLVPFWGFENFGSGIFDNVGEIPVSTFGLILILVITIAIMIIIGVLLVKEKDWDVGAVFALLFFTSTIIFGLSIVIVALLAYIIYFILTTVGLITVGVLLMVIILLSTSDIYQKESKVKRLICLLIVVVFTISSIFLHATILPSKIEEYKKLDLEARGYCKMVISEDRTYYSVVGLEDIEKTDIIIPNEYKGKPVKAISKDAFSNGSLTSIVIGENVTTISAFAFQNNDLLTEIIIPDSVTYLGESCFQSCDALIFVELGSSVRILEPRAFLSCVSLNNINIPRSVTEINWDAFYNCSSLNKIFIPDSVEYIGTNVFTHCYSLTIYCEAPSKPKAWRDSWNKGVYTVWGHKEI